jgi:hypothetical protein
MILYSAEKNKITGNHLSFIDKALAEIKPSLTEGK